MIKINKTLLQKMAQLAHLTIDEHHEAALRKDLSKIVTWMEKLQELDTTGVDPLDTMSLEPHALEEDTPVMPLAHERGLTNAPSKDSNYFRVPQVKA